MKTQVSNPWADVIPRQTLFQSFFMGGFECSTHRVRSGRRLDLIASTGHDQFAQQDYERIKSVGLRVAREGIRWHLVEQTPGQYDFSSVLPIVRAARSTRTQVVWDLAHFGWPDHLDIFKPEFVSALAEFGSAFARWLSKEMEGPAFFVPVNEPSFFSWAAGDEGSIYPFATGRGFELKTQLVRAAIRAMDAIWAERPDSRFVHVDPIIHVIAEPGRPQDKGEAEAYRISQFQAWDMLSGRLWPELGGAEKYLDVIGMNFYPHNQWFYNLKGFRRIRKFTAIKRSNPLYRPFRDMLREVYERYRRPMFIAETGAEDRARRPWFAYVCNEVRHAIDEGVPIHGICLYPIVNYPGWADNRHCQNGLWDYADQHGHRGMYAPLARELKKWQKVFDRNGSDASNDSAERESAAA